VPSSDTARLTVNRWEGIYTVPEDHPDPEALRRRLDDLVGEHLAQACAHWLSFAVDPADPSVWRIRDLHLDFSLDPDFASSERIAKGWGEHLATRIHKILEYGEENDSVLHFPHRAGYLAQFILDLAAGRAWGKWYYEEFDSLRSLPVNRAISAAFVGEKGMVVDILRQIAALRRLEEVLPAIGEGDAGEIYEACFDPSGAQPSAGDERVWTSRFLESWNDALLRPPHGDCRFRDALRILARVGAQFPGVEQSEPARSALFGLLELRCVLSQLRSSRVVDRILCGAANGDLSQCIELALAEGAADPVRGLEFLARVSDGDTHWTQQAAAVLLSDSLREATLLSQGRLSDESIGSFFAGAFLLGPSFVELGVGHLAAAAVCNSSDPETLAATLRHLVILKCLGRSRVSEAAFDAGLRLFSGFHRPSLFDELNTVPADSVRLNVLQKDFLQALLGADQYDGRCLLLEVLPLSGSPRRALILRDVLRDQWIVSSVLPENSPDILATCRLLIRSTLEITDKRPEVLFLLGDLPLSREEQESLLPFAGNLINLHCDSTEQCGELAAIFGVSPERFARLLQTSDDDLEYFTLHGLWPEMAFDPAWDLAFTLIARSCLKNFARRLMGFESSGPEHLYRNVLAGMGAIRSSSEKIEVRLPRCPLFIVLRLCGLHEQSFRVPWLQERDICLLPSQE
jgi:hypothetical protein